MPPQLPKQLRQAVSLIEDDQFVFVVREIFTGIGELGAVVLAFMIQVD
jgi:hypothetical protein